MSYIKRWININLKTSVLALIWLGQIIVQSKDFDFFYNFHKTCIFLNHITALENKSLCEFKNFSCFVLDSNDFIMWVWKWEQLDLMEMHHTIFWRNFWLNYSIKNQSISIFKKIKLVRKLFTGRMNLWYCKKLKNITKKTLN